MFIPVNVQVAKSSKPPAPPLPLTKPVVPSTAPSDIRDRIRGYIKPVKDRNMIGTGAWSQTICELLFTKTRSSTTAIYEQGFKMPLREDLVEKYVDSVLIRANMYYGQHFAIEVEPAEPEMFFP